MDAMERRIRAARPASAPRDRPLSDRAERELQALVSSAEPTRPRRRRTVLAGAGVVALAVLVAVIGPTVWAPKHAWAVTPAPLRITPMQGTASGLLDELSRSAAASRQPAATGTIHIAMQVWTLGATVDGQVMSDSIVPQDYAISRAPDGARTVVVTVGRPSDADGREIDAGVPRKGTVLWKESDAPGEYHYLYGAPFPVDAGRVGAYFRAVLGTPESPDAAQVIQQIATVLMEQELSPAQRAAFLRYLASLPGIRLEGRTTDRLGRPGILFSVPRAAAPDYVEYLAVDPRTGTILLTETSYVGLARTDIRSPSVISYRAWR